MNTYPSKETISVINKKVISYLKRNPNASLPTLYKRFRPLKEITSEGDIVLLIYLVILKNTYTKKSYNRRQINNCFKLTEDYSNLERGVRSEIVSQLDRCQKSGNMLPEND